MDKKTIGRNVLSALAMMIAVSAPAQDNFVSAPPQDNIEKLIEDLKLLYPSGMFVTGLNLWNIEYKIDSRDGEALRQRAGNESIPLIKAVIDKADTSNVIYKIAFIHLNLETLNAFEMRQDGSGTPTRLAWTRGEVRAAAIWCHEFLKNGGKIIRETQLLASSNEISVEDAMATLAGFSDNMFVSERQLTDLKGEIRSLFARSTAEIAALEGQKPELYAKINGFSKDFDREQILTKVGGNRIREALTATRVPENAPPHLKLVYNALDLWSQDDERFLTIIAEYRDDTR